MESFFDHTNHEIYLVSSIWKNKRYGFIATWVLPLSLAGVHRRFLIAISTTGASWPAILQSKTIGLQMLAQGQERCVVPFGCYSSADRDKFEGYELEEASLPFLRGSMGCIEASLIAHYPSHDRVLAICQSESYLYPAPHRLPLTKNYLTQVLSDKELEQLRARKRDLSIRSSSF